MRGMTKNKLYFIKRGYKLNLDQEGKAIPYLDCIEDSKSYQVAVYKFARKLIKEKKLKNILDIGCGYGLKLKKFILPVCQDIVGIDQQHAISFCKENYKFGMWCVDNIENPKLKLKRKFDLIISSDVIEHLVDPDKLLEYIKRFCYKNTIIILSSPERDIVRGKYSFGPPENKAHVREWNKREFYNYIKSKYPR